MFNENSTIFLNFVQKLCVCKNIHDEGIESEFLSPITDARYSYSFPNVGFFAIFIAVGVTRERTNDPHSRAQGVRLGCQVVEMDRRTVGHHWSSLLFLNSPKV